MNRIVAISLLKNEDLRLSVVLGNLIDFADEILLADHHSTDRTPVLAKAFAERYPHVHYRQIAHPRDSHAWIRSYMNQPVWALAVDGDEIYDPKGLEVLGRSLRSGTYDQYRQIYGHAFHCEALDLASMTATGYATPPCRTITKLHNFNAIRDWEGPCPERLHGGTIHFNPGWTAEDSLWLYKQESWEESAFRCLHTVFLPRSSLDDVDAPPRRNISELNEMGWMARLRSRVSGREGERPSAYKNDKYRRGEKLIRDVASFFPEGEPA